MTRPSPQQPEIAASSAEVEGIYPATAVEAAVAQQRQWYDALCQGIAALLGGGIGTASPRQQATEGRE